MEALLGLFGLLFFIAFGMALIGVPIIFRRLETMRVQIAKLEQKLVSPELSESKTKTQDLQTSPSVGSVEQANKTELSEAVLRDSFSGDSQLPSVELPAGDQLSTQQIELNSEPAAESVEAKLKSSDVKSQVSSKVELPGQTTFVNETTEPNPPSKASHFSTLLDKLLAMNVTAQVGAIVLIFGAIFLGKYASDIGILTLQAKLMLMGLASIVVAAVGIFLSRRLKIYSEVLQGTGLAGWLVTLFVAHVLNEQLHWVTTLILGVMGISFIGYRSIRQNSQPLAMVAFLGGFLTPFIASSEVSSLWRLFSYLGVLNVAVVVTAYFKPWRWLVREAYVSSFGLLAGLMLAEYLQQDLAQWVIQAPMLYFNIICVICFALLAQFWLANPSLEFKQHVSGLLFGVPAAAVTALAALFHGESSWTAASLAGLSAIYFALYVYGRQTSLLLVGIVVATAAIPFALNDSMTTLVYSIEGLAFTWWSIKHLRRVSFVWGLGLQLVAAVFAFHLFQDFEVRESQLYVSWVLYGGVFASAVCSAVFFRSETRLFTLHREKILASILGFALVIWFYQWGFYLAETLTRLYTFWSMAFVFALTAIALLFAARRLNWSVWAQGGRISGAGFVLAALLFLADYAERASGAQLLAIAAISTAYFVFRVWHAANESQKFAWDGIFTWFGSAVVAAISFYFAPTVQTDWNTALMCVVPLALVVFQRTLLPKVFQPSQTRKHVRTISFVLVFLFSFTLLAGIGNYAPLPFWPLLHPVFLLFLIAAEAIFRMVRHHREFKMVWVIWVGVGFTMELNRWVFHYAGVPFQLESWLDSALTQTVWSLVWTLLGGALMITGARISRSRTRWFVGAGVLATVVLKLFILDLSAVDTLYRIGSFMAVGAALLGIGYLAPMPNESKKRLPRDEQNANA